MPRPLTVALLGVDGSGKTTQARLLAAWLRERGVPARYVESGGGRPFTDWVAHRLGRADTRALVGERGRVLVETALRAVALTVATAVPRLTGQVAVMDRFAYCQYAVVRARGDRGEGLARAVLGRFPAPDLVLLMELPAGLAQARVAARGRDREEAGHLAAFAEAYRALPEAGSFTPVDASGTVAQVHGRARAVVLPHLRTE